MAKIKNTQSIGGSINKLTKMDALIIDGKIIIETIKLKIIGSEHVP